MYPIAKADIDPADLYDRVRTDSEPMTPIDDPNTSDGGEEAMMGPYEGVTLIEEAAASTSTPVVPEEGAPLPIQVARETHVLVKTCVSTACCCLIALSCGTQGQGCPSLEPVVHCHPGGHQGPEEESPAAVDRASQQEEERREASSSHHPQSLNAWSQ